MGVYCIYTFIIFYDRFGNNMKWLWRDNLLFFFFFFATEKRNKDQDKKEGEDCPLFIFLIYFLFKGYIYLSIREDYLFL